MIGAGIGLAIAGPIGAAIGFLGAKLLGGLGKVLGSIVNALFGTKTSIVGQGIYGGAQSLGSILSGGFDASYYTDIKKTKKFFGISVGSSYSTQYAAASAELEQQFSLIFSGFYDAISAAAGPLGMSLDEVQSRLAGFVVNIGKIDLKGLTGEQIQEKLTAVFGAAADSIARAAIPGLEQFQKVGEGYFETLVRVASSIEAVTSSLSLLGTSVEGLSLTAKINLFDLFGSANDMASATSDYFSLFYTKAEQTAALTAQMAQVFGSLGLTLPDSIAGFRALVDAQDLTTEAGRAAYVALIQLAPAFADLIGAAQDAASAAAIVDERLGLERQLLELQGNTAALRALDLAQLDESNRALQEQIWALQDQQKAADEAAAAAEKLRSAWTQITDGLLAEVSRIRGSMDSGTKTYAQALSDFNAATLGPGAADGLALIDIEAESASVTLTVSGSPIYSRTQSFNIGGNAIDTWFAWFFEPLGKKTGLLFLDVPVYETGVLTVTLTRDNPADAVKCGTLRRAHRHGRTEVRTKQKAAKPVGVRKRAAALLCNAERRSAELNFQPGIQCDFARCPELLFEHSQFVLAHGASDMRYRHPPTVLAGGVKSDAVFCLRKHLPKTHKCITGGLVLRHVKTSILPSTTIVPLLFFLGAPGAALFLQALKTVGGLNQHSNLRWDLWLRRWAPTRLAISGLERIFVMQDFHHAHHGLGPQGRSAGNFGNIFTLFDWLHGTGHLPHAKQERFGLPAGVSVEPWYVRVWWPILRTRERADLRVPTAETVRYSSIEIAAARAVIFTADDKAIPVQIGY